MNKGREALTHKIESVPCTHLPVTKIEKAIEFWVDEFGCTYGDEYEPGSKTASLRVENDHWIFLYETEEMPNKAYFSGGTLRNSDDNQIFAATLNVKNPDHLYQQLKTNGVKVGEYRKAWTGYAFDCYDPDGNKFNIWGGEWKEA